MLKAPRRRPVERPIPASSVVSLSIPKSNYPQFRVCDSQPQFPRQHLIGSVIVHQREDGSYSVDDTRQKGATKCNTLHFAIRSLGSIQRGQLETRIISGKNFSNKRNENIYDRGTYGVIDLDGDNTVGLVGEGGWRATNSGRYIGINRSAIAGVPCDFSKNPLLLTSSGHKKKQKNAPEMNPGSHTHYHFFCADPNACIEVYAIQGTQRVSIQLQTTGAVTLDPTHPQPVLCPSSSSPNSSNSAVEAPRSVPRGRPKKKRVGEDDDYVDEKMRPKKMFKSKSDAGLGVVPLPALPLPSMSLLPLPIGLPIHVAMPPRMTGTLNRFISNPMLSSTSSSTSTSSGMESVAILADSDSDSDAESPSLLKRTSSSMSDHELSQLERSDSSSSVDRADSTFSLFPPINSSDSDHEGSSPSRSSSNLSLPDFDEAQLFDPSASPQHIPGLSCQAPPCALMNGSPYYDWASSSAVNPSSSSSIIFANNGNEPAFSSSTGVLPLEPVRSLGYYPELANINLNLNMAPSNNSQSMNYGGILVRSPLIKKEPYENLNVNNLNIDDHGTQFPGLDSFTVMINNNDESSQW